MNGKFSSINLKKDVDELLYHFNSDKESSTLSLNITNDNDNPIKISIYFNNGEYYLFEHEIIAYQTIELTGIILKPDEKIYAKSSENNVYVRTHGYEENHSKLRLPPISWVTEPFINLDGKNVNLQFIATNATSYRLHSGTIPDGTKLSKSGLLTGNILRLNTSYSFTLEATNDKGQIAYRVFFMNAENAKPSTDNLTFTIPKKVARGSFVLPFIYGAIDPDGGLITYDVIIPNLVTASKNKGLIDNEIFRCDFSKNLKVGDILRFTVISSNSTSGKSIVHKDVEIIEADLTPEPFNFTDLYNKELTTFYESEIKEIKGLQTNYKFFVSVDNGGQFRYGKTLNELNNNSFNSYDLYGIETDNTGILYLQVKQKTTNVYNDTHSINIGIGDYKTKWSVTTREPDIKADNELKFNPIIDAELNTKYDSNTVILTGLEPNYDIFVSYTDGELYIFGNLVPNNSRVKTNSNGELEVKCNLKSINDFSKSNKMTVTIGENTGEFSITTRKIKDVPKIWDIPDKYNQELNTAIYSESVLLTDLEKEYEYNFSILGDGNLMVTVPPTSNNMFIKTVKVKTNNKGELLLQVLCTSSKLFDTILVNKIVISCDKQISSLENRTAIFELGTRKIKNPDNTFIFNTIKNAELLTDYISDNIVKLSGYESNYSYVLRCTNMLITGSDKETDIKIVNTNVGSAISNNWYNSIATVKTNSNGEMWLRAMGKSQATNLSTTSGIVIVENSAKGTFDIITKADTTPNKFMFIDILNADLSLFYVSNIVKIDGFSPNIPINFSITGDSTCKVQASSSLITGSFIETFSPVTTNSNGEIYVRLQMQSSSSYATTKTTTFTIGDGVNNSASWNVITKKAITEIDDIKFDKTIISCDYTNTVVYSDYKTISGNDVEVNFSIVGAKLEVNGVLYNTGKLKKGDVIRIQSSTIPSKSFTSNTTTSFSLIIGSKTFTWEIERTQCNLINNPNDITFTTETLSCENSLSTIISNEIVISGKIDSSITFSVSNGTASVNGGSFVTSGTLVLNDKVKLKANTPSKTYGTTNTVKVTFNYGGKTTEWSINRTCPACTTNVRNYPSDGSPTIILSYEFPDYSSAINYMTNPNQIIPANTLKGVYRTESFGLGIVGKKGGNFGDVILTGNHVHGINFPAKGTEYIPYPIRARDILESPNYWTKDVGFNLNTEFNDGYITLPDITKVNDFHKRNLRINPSASFNVKVEGKRWNFYTSLIEDYDDCTGSTKPPCKTHEIPNTIFLSMSIINDDLRRNAFADPANVILPIGSIQGYYRTTYTGLGVVTGCSNGDIWCIYGLTGSNTWGAGIPSTSLTNPVPLRLLDFTTIFENWRDTVSSKPYFISNEIANTNIKIDNKSLTNFNNRKYRMKAGTGVIKTDPDSSVRTVWLEGTLLYDENC